MTCKNVLVIGSDSAGLQAARDLADAGMTVDLVESGPFLIGSGDPQPNYMDNAQQLEIIKNPRIQIWTNSQVMDLNQDGSGMLAQISKAPRFIDLEKCTACGDCVEACPVTIPETGLKAIHFGGQPGCAVIEKSGISPCTAACPAGIHVQGYVALLNQGRYREAYQLIHDALPFPSVCGRVCNHYCEQACSRSQIDQPVNLMALKRFVADWAFDHPDQIEGDLVSAAIERIPFTPPSGKNVAVVGAGPAGLTAARDLVRRGHQATVFDDNPVAGGMMRVGIPPHRLPYDRLEQEIEQILSEGVQLQLNTWVDDIPGLLEQGFDAVLIATGAHQAVKAPIEGADHPGNLLSLEFLKSACLGEPIDLTGRRVIVLGGGDVAMDAARVAVRLGTADVKIVCRGMRASFTEIKEAEEEGIKIVRGRVFKKVVTGGKEIQGVECLEAEVGEVVDGRRQFRELPGTEHLIVGDLVIWALGQRPDFSFLPPGDAVSLSENRGIKADDRLMTSLAGVFTAGDVHRGTTFFVVDAVGDGHRAAESIHAYLMGEQAGGPDHSLGERILTPDEIKSRLDGRKSARAERQGIPCLAVEERAGNFREVDLGLGEKAALLESGRCLICGPCSECMACVEVCEPGAILHDQAGSQWTIQSRAVIAPDGFVPEKHLPGLIIRPGLDWAAGSAAAYEIFKEYFPETKEMAPPSHKRPREGDRVGLAVCQCADQISKYIQTEQVCRTASLWPEIEIACEVRVACSPEGGEELKRIIRENGLGRLILAACSCCSLDQVCYSCTYQRTRCKDNLGIFSPLERLARVDFVNIREQCAWPHRRSKKKATSSAVDLIRSSLGRIPAESRRILPEGRNDRRVLIVGRGQSAQISQESLDRLGIGTASIEVVTDPLVRTGGRYQAGSDSPGWDGLILAPGSGAELEHILGSVLLSNQQPILTARLDLYGSLPHGLLICRPEVDPGTSGKGAAARMAAWLEKTFNQADPLSAFVDRRRCRACGTCQEVCGFGIPELIDDGSGSAAYINPWLCQDCGVCTAHCPSGAIRPGSDQIEELESILELALN